MVTSWKTTLGGILSAVGTYLAGNADPMLKTIGQILSGIGLLLMGFTARDNNVSSEKAGAKTT